jgi:hypothetical protein
MTRDTCSLTLIFYKEELSETIRGSTEARTESRKSPSAQKLSWLIRFIFKLLFIFIFFVDHIFKFLKWFRTTYVSTSDSLQITPFFVSKSHN